MANILRGIRKSILRVLILGAVFVAALLGFFVWTLLNTEKEYTVYTALEKPRLPVVSVEFGDLNLNPMQGYLTDMGNAAADDCITVLPEDRRLSIRADGPTGNIAGVSYEVRSLDLQHFIERTAVTDFEITDGVLRAVLPVQNMIEPDEQYLLTIKLDTGEEVISYYTRIIWESAGYAGEMLTAVSEFTRKTFDSNEARDLTQFMETDQKADNTDLSHVTIHSSFQQLTWAGTGMQLLGRPQIRIRQYQGLMGAFETDFLTQTVSEDGRREYYTNTESFVWKGGQDRLYLMNYDRRTRQLFDGSKQAFSGKRIMLGILDPEEAGVTKSANSRFLAFQSGQDLWVYDQDSRRGVNVFSFRIGIGEDERPLNTNHGIRLLSIEDNGDIDFVVYGYMSRGRHEGYNGITYYRYTGSAESISELFFISSDRSFGRIAAEIGELCVKGTSDMLYIKQNDAVAAIDIKSLEMVEIASGLESAGWAVSPDRSRFAWTDQAADSSTEIRILDTKTGAMTGISAEPDEYLQIVGFSGSNLIAGRSRRTDERRIHGRKVSVPLYRLEITDPTLLLIKEYEKQDYYIDEVKLEENRIHFGLFEKTGAFRFEHRSDDIIVYTQAEQEGLPAGLGRSDSGVKKKVCYVELDREIKTTKTLKIDVPQSVSHENAGQLDLAREVYHKDMHFLCYSDSRLVGIERELAAAVRRVYDSFGYVLNEDSVLIYNRADRSNLHTLRGAAALARPLTEKITDFPSNTLDPDAGMLLLNARGLDLNQALYYVYRGIPAVLCTGEDSFCLLYGFDNYNVRIYRPEQGDRAEYTEILTREDAARLLKENAADLLVGLGYTR